MPLTAIPAEPYSSDGRLKVTDVLDVPQLAALLKVSKETVRRMARAGVIKPIQGCRILRFSGATINKLLAG